MRLSQRRSPLVLLVALAACAGQGARASDSSAADSAGRTGAASDSAALVGVEWTLTELDGSPVSTASGGSTPTLRFTVESGTLSASGMAGCNRFRGTATTSGGELRFGPLVSTKMACPALALETRYLGALDGVRGYRMAARDLELLAGERVVARFTSP